MIENFLHWLHLACISKASVHATDPGRLARHCLKIVLSSNLKDFDASYWRVKGSDESTYALVMTMLKRHVDNAKSDDRYPKLVMELVETYRVAEVFFRFRVNREKYHTHGLFALYRTIQIIDRDPEHYGSDAYLAMAAALTHDFLEVMGEDSSGAFPKKATLVPLLLQHGMSEMEAERVFEIIEKTNYGDFNNPAHWNPASEQNHFFCNSLSCAEKAVIVSDLMQITASDYMTRVTTDLPGKVGDDIPEGLGSLTINAISALQNDLGHDGSMDGFLNEVFGPTVGSAFDELRPSAGA